MDPSALPVAPVTRCRWVGVGRSTDPDAAAAGGAAARAALDARPDARLAILFASDRYDLDALAGAVQDVVGPAAVVGASSPAEIGPDGPAGASVVVVVLGGEGFAVSTIAVPDAASDLRDAGVQAAAALGDVADREHRVLLLLSGARSGNQQEIVRGAYSVAGAGVPLVGGCAGTRVDGGPTLQVCGREVVREGLVAAAIGSDAPLGIGMHHGWSGTGAPMLVTRSEGTRVLELDDRPALDVYRERAADLGFTDLGGFAGMHPLGLHRRAGEEHVRVVASWSEEERWLQSNAEIPQGALVWLLQGDGDSILDATDSACAEALGALGGAPPLGLVVFGCWGRHGLLGEDGSVREVARVVGHADGAPVGGFYTFGEIARTRGVAGFHNYTFVVLALG